MVGRRAHRLAKHGRLEDLGKGVCFIDVWHGTADLAIVILPPINRVHRQSDRMAIWAQMKGRQVMPSKRFTAEQIIPKLREAEVEQAKGSLNGHTISASTKGSPLN